MASRPRERKACRTLLAAPGAGRPARCTPSAPEARASPAEPGAETLTSSFERFRPILSIISPARDWSCGGSRSFSRSWMKSTPPADQPSTRPRSRLAKSGFLGRRIGLTQQASPVRNGTELHGVECKAVSQLRWPDYDREEWFSLGEITKRSLAFPDFLQRGTHRGQ